MNFQQLEAVCTIVRHRYNISAAAAALDRSQSAVSRQVKDLEEHLGAPIFLRTPNKLIGLTPQGKRILGIGQRILQDVKSLERVGQDDAADDDGGEIRVATSHIHARYLLPGTVAEFTRRFEHTMLTLNQCDPVQCREVVAAGDSDLGISTIAARPNDTIVTVPVYRLPRCVVVPRGHPLASERSLTLKDLAEYPLISNPSTFVGRSILDEAFDRAGLRPRIACNVTDADVCKTYVRLGMGFAVLATLAFDRREDNDLVAIDASHLFRPGILNVVLRKHGYLSRPLESFLSVFAPHLSRDLIQQAVTGYDIDRARLAQRVPVATGTTRSKGAR
jgi:LysR family cys regulon transcriptional activator